MVGCRRPPVFSGMPPARLEALLAGLLRRAGMRDADAKAVAWVYAVMTGRGVGHHDVGGFPGLLDRLERGTLAIRPRIRRVVDKAGIVVLDGANAPGPLASYRMTEAAIAKARKHGIGMACCRNSNHFLGAAPYALLAAQKGMLGIAASNTIPIMGTGASRGRAIGNNPWGFGAPTGAGFPFLLDICNAYASYGKLHQYAARGWKVPEYWGLDSAGKPTTDPSEIYTDGVPLPVAGHKGFGASILVELLTGVLSGGAVTDEMLAHRGSADAFSHAAIVIDIARFMSPARFRAKTRTMIARLKTHPPLDPRNPTLLPGERSHRAAQEMKKGGVPLTPKTVERLNAWCDRLGIGQGAAGRGRREGMGKA